jgi:hypothetical protein
MSSSADMASPTLAKPLVALRVAAIEDLMPAFVVGDPWWSNETPWCNFVDL